MNPKVESIKVRINDKLMVDLTPEQARSLFQELKNVLGENSYIGIPVPTPAIPWYPPQPYSAYPRPIWSGTPYPEITC
jgi:hypothetical protein